MLKKYVSVGMIWRLWHGLACLFVALPGALLAQQGEDRVSIEMTNAHTSQFGTSATLEVSGKITNGTSQRVEWALLEVSAYEEDKSVVSINPHTDGRFFPFESQSQLPYLGGNAAVKVLHLQPPLAAGETREVKSSVFSRQSQKFSRISSIGLEISSAGGTEYAKGLLGSTLIGPIDRELLAKDVSISLGKRYSYVTDSGSLQFPAGVEELPIASRAEQTTKGGVNFRRSRGRKGEVEVEVVNNADRVININILGANVAQNVAVSAGQQKKITIPGGMFSFTATASDCRSLNGRYEWENGSAYSWTFTIR